MDYKYKVKKAIKNLGEEISKDKLNILKEDDMKCILFSLLRGQIDDMSTLNIKDQSKNKIILRTKTSVIHSEVGFGDGRETIDLVLFKPEEEIEYFTKKTGNGIARCKRDDPKIEIVLPLLSNAVLCAMASTPRANPLTIVYPSFTRFFTAIFTCSVVQ
jgi:hypothetical protein